MCRMTNTSSEVYMVFIRQLKKTLVIAEGLNPAVVIRTTE